MDSAAAMAFEDFLGSWVAGFLPHRRRLRWRLVDKAGKMMIFWIVWVEVQRIVRMQMRSICNKRKIWTRFGRGKWYVQYSKKFVYYFDTKNSFCICYLDLSTSVIYNVVIFMCDIFRTVIRTRTVQKDYANQLVKVLVSEQWCNNHSRARMMVHRLT